MQNNGSEELFYLLLVRSGFNEDLRVKIRGREHGVGWGEESMLLRAVEREGMEKRGHEDSGLVIDIEIVAYIHVGRKS